MLNTTDKYFISSEYNTWKEEVKLRNIAASSTNTLHCEYCHITENLVIHHIHPQKTYPHMTLDPDNGLVCCQHCHITKAHIDECNLANLANKICY